MKINKAKLLVGTLAVAAVAATVGSISGTVAWFQYSTRVTAAYSGAAAHVSENLQIRLSRPDVGTSGQDGYVAGYNTGAEEGWKADLGRADINAYIANVRGAGADHDLRPITSGNALANGGVATSFYKSPIYQYSSTYDKWDAATALDYVELPIELRVLDRNGEATNEFLAKKVYLTDLTIASASTGSKKDITPALRVSFDTADNDVTFSQKGEDVVTTGKLDLNADGNDDKVAGYEWETLSDFVYGDANSVEKTTEIKKSANNALTYLADDSDPQAILGNELGATTTSNVFKVTVRIYIEGWQKLDSETITGTPADYADKAAMVAAMSGESPFVPTDGTTYKTNDGKFWKWVAADSDFTAVVAKQSAVWDDDDYVSASFNVGMRFSVEAHKDSDHA